MRTNLTPVLRKRAVHTCLFLTLLLPGFICHADDGAELKLLRQKLLIAVNSSKTTDSLYTVLEKMPGKSPVIIGYLGTLESLKGKHAWNPYTKVKHLNAGQKILQQAITADPHNIEIRYLRFSIEYHLPGFLGMAKHINEDRDELLVQLAAKNHGTADKQLTGNMIRFLLESKKCTAQQDEALRKHLAELK
jgi:hypothetical protein